MKISTTLIQVDVTFTDKNGKVITDLKPEDFEIFENGEKQAITNFSFVSNVKTSVAPTKQNTKEIQKMRLFHLHRKLGIRPMR